MHRIFQTFIDSLTESSDEPTLRLAIEAASSALDLSCFAYLVLPRASAGGARLISNYPTQWTTHYLQCHYERFDPVIAQALGDPEPFEWGPGMGPSTLSRQQLDLLDNAAFFGIRYGFTIPIHDGRGPIAAVTYASQDRGPVFQHCIERNGRVLQLMALYFHAHARRKVVTDRMVGGIALSPRELECLEWAARGKSAWDIGQILGITRRTAAFHLDNAKAKLGVHSICQAVVLLAAARP
ncbi:MAG: LuxR family transcriptional regulator [Rhodospirillales bacterium]|nr:LuxR family transcriptional regulator [Rhodospirillales bacterium]